MVNKKRFPHHLSIFLTEKTYQQLNEKCNKQKMSQSDFIRTLIDYAPKNITSKQEIQKKLLYELNKIGNNINQIAHAANMNALTKNEVVIFEAYCEKLDRVLKNVTKVFLEQD